MLKILNFVQDEKFIDGAIEYLSTTPDDAVHDYVIVTSETIEQFQYIKHHPDKVFQLSPEQVIEFIEKQHYDTIFLHCLFSCPLNLIAEFPTNIKVCWFGWGYDMYSEDGSRIITMQLHKPVTKKELEKFEKRHENNHYWKKTKAFVKKLLSIPSNKEREQMLYKKAVQRIDYFSGVLSVEYELALQCPFFNAKPVEFHYYEVSPYRLETIKENNIIIGNSADPRNNHLDLMEYIEKLDFKGHKVYMPLSYCGYQEYIEKVKEVYYKKVGENFQPLESFINKDDYYDILNSCSVGIFFHERQQAMGNIKQILRNGGKVFLSETSVAYQYLTSIGVSVFSVQTDLCDAEINKPLSALEKENNRRLMTPTLEYRINLLIKLYRDIQNE